MAMLRSVCMLMLIGVAACAVSISNVSLPTSISFNEADGRSTYYRTVTIIMMPLEVLSRIHARHAPHNYTLHETAFYLHLFAHALLWRCVRCVPLGTQAVAERSPPRPPPLFPALPQSTSLKR